MPPDTGSTNRKLLCEGLDVSRETFEKLEIYFDLLTKWQAKTNLVADSTLDSFWQRHVADSAQCVRIKPNGQRWTDIGSGAGFPGMVIAIILGDNPGSNITLVESNLKKCAFLRVVARETATQVNVQPLRLEKYIERGPVPEIVTARAVLPLIKLLDMSTPWLSGKTIGLFHKGRDYRQEIENARSKWQYDLIEHQSVVAADSAILEITNLKLVN